MQFSDSDEENSCHFWQQNLVEEKNFEDIIKLDSKQQQLSNFPEQINPWQQIQQEQSQRIRSSSQDQQTEIFKLQTEIQSDQNQEYQPQEKKERKYQQPHKINLFKQKQIQQQLKEQSQEYLLQKQQQLSFLKQKLQKEQFSQESLQLQQTDDYEQHECGQCGAKMPIEFAEIHPNECSIKYLEEITCQYCDQWILKYYQKDHFKVCTGQLIKQFENNQNESQLRKQNLPQIDLSEDEKNCAICMLEIKQEIKHLICFHSYHTQCIDQWLQKSQLCPICQIDVTSIMNK